MTMKMFTVKILLIDMQLDQNIVRTCALHSFLQITHTTEEMKIVLEKMKVNLRTNLTQVSELKHLVRQKNKQFAQLLNRVREAKITEHDETTLKGRVTTLDHPDHFTDALHVYGTNQQADQYNATKLQKLDTSKYIIQSSDITRDREMRQVKISLNSKKHRYRRTTKSLNHRQKCLCEIDI